MKYFTEELKFEGRTWRLVFHKIPNYIWYGSRWLFAPTPEDIQTSTYEEFNAYDNTINNISKSGWFTRVGPKNESILWPAESPNEFTAGDQVHIISGSYAMTVVSNNYEGVLCCWYEGTVQEKTFPPYVLKKLPPEKHCEKKIQSCSREDCDQDGVVTCDDETWCEFHATDVLLSILLTDDVSSLLELSNHRHLLLTNQDNPIQVWPFDKAPACYQNLSSHGGDEDWVALIPKGQDYPLWADDGTAFGCRVSEHELEDGRTVLIGAHF